MSSVEPLMINPPLLPYPHMIPYSVRFGLHFRTTRLGVDCRATHLVTMIVRADRNGLLHAPGAVRHDAVAAHATRRHIHLMCASNRSGLHLRTTLVGVERKAPEDFIPQSEVAFSHT